MSTATFPQGSNTYIKSTESTNNLIVSFSRNPDDFALNKYIQIVPVSKDTGLYTELNTEEAGRILNTNDADHLWHDGEDEPSHRGNTEKHSFKPYTTQRRVFGYRLGSKAVDQAQWDVVGVHGRIKAQQCMTSRTQRAVTLLTTSGNYPSGHTSAVSSLGIGKWDVSTSARLDIKKSLRYGQNKIRLSTLGAVKPGDMRLVINPNCAGLMAESQEIVDLIKQSPAAKDYIKNNLGPNSAYGLPAELYGVEIVIEDAVKVTNRKGATKATSYVLGDDSAILCSRPGDLVAPTDSNEAPRFSTATLFVYEDMTVETKYDSDNRVHKGRIVDDNGFVMTAGIAGFLFQSVTG